MVRVILDSNFLFVPFQFQVDIFEELEALLGRYEPVVLSTTLEEISNLAKKRSVKMRRQASAVLELVGRCRVVEAELKAGESYDDVILRKAKEWKSPVATNDARLRKRLREAGLANIFLRQKARLEIEGHISEGHRRVVRVKDWEDFKRLIVELNPQSIAYNIEQGVPARHLTGLRLIIPVEEAQYVLIDTAMGDRLRKTGISLHRDKQGNMYIRDEDVVEFVRSEVKRKDLKLHSYWTI